MKVLTCFVSLVAATAALADKSGGHDHHGHGKRKPNIIYLMSDDQDIRLGSMAYMDTLQKEMIAKGANFLSHHVTTAQCCPSRVGLLRGQATHNTNVTNVFAPGYVSPVSKRESG